MAQIKISEDWQKGYIAGLRAMKKIRKSSLKVLNECIKFELKRLKNWHNQT